MRRKKTDFQGRVNGDVAIEFGDEGMTSYAGLELLIRYLRRIGFNAQVRRHWVPWSTEATSEWWPCAG